MLCMVAIACIAERAFPVRPPRGARARDRQQITHARAGRRARARLAARARGGMWGRDWLIANARAQRARAWQAAPPRGKFCGVRARGRNFESACSLYFLKYTGL